MSIMEDANSSSVSSIVSDTLGLQGQLTRATEMIHRLKTENQTLSENNQRLFDKLQDSRQKLHRTTEQHTTTVNDYMALSRDFLEAQKSWEADLETKRKELDDFQARKLPQDAGMVEIAVERRVREEFEAALRGLEEERDVWRASALEQEVAARRVEAAQEQVGEELRAEWGREVSQLEALVQHLRSEFVFIFLCVVFMSMLVCSKGCSRRGAGSWRRSAGSGRRTRTRLPAGSGWRTCRSRWRFCRSRGVRCCRR